jgi:hypothetical protein
MSTFTSPPQQQKNMFSHQIRNPRLESIIAIFGLPIHRGGEGEKILDPTSLRRPGLIQHLRTKEKKERRDLEELIDYVLDIPCIAHVLIFSCAHLLCSSWREIDRGRNWERRREVKTGSQSLTIVLRMPCSLTMASKKTCATVVAVYGWPSGRKCAALENRSTTVRIADFPLTVGNPSTKLMAMSTPTVVGMSSGCKRPVGCSCSILLRWQTKHAQTKSHTAVQALGMKKSTRRR